MKRILSSVVVIVMFLFCSINCHAEEYNETHTSDVYGRYNFYSNEGMYTAVSNNGCYKVITNDGIQFEVYSSNTDLTLVIHEVSTQEKECYGWFKSCLPKEVVSFVPYDIFFINSLGDRVEMNSDVEIAISGAKTNVSVLWLSCSGNLLTIDHVVIDNKLAFKTTMNSGYYLLCETIGEIQSPQTGDPACLILWIFLLVASIIMLVILTRRYTVIRRDN